MARFFLDLPVGLAVLSLTARTAALDVKTMKYYQPHAPLITQAPSVEALDTKLRVALKPRTVITCATACIDAAVTKSTTCSIGDFACQCQSTNALSIYLGSEACIYSACGFAVAES